MSGILSYLRQAQTSRLDLTIPILMVVVFIMKLGQFLIIPFLAIYLSHFSLSPVHIGLIIASGQLCHSITSLFTGQLSDKYSARQVIIMSLFGASIAYAYLYVSQSLACLICLNSLIGVFRAFFDTATKTFLATHIAEQSRNFVFGLRYAVLNLTAALGPLIGTRYAAENSTELFHLIAYAYCATSLFLLLFWSKNTNIRSRSVNRLSIRDTLDMLQTNPSLKLLFLISLIGYSLYSQVSSSLAQYIVHQFEDGISLYSNMLILNAITCVLLQIFIGPLIKRVNNVMLASLGLSLLALSFLGFCLARNPIMLNASILILSLGEVIFFPLNDLLLAKIAPPHLIGRCYGILNASTIGLAIGPALGGGIYQFGNHYALFILCSLGSLLTIGLYRKLVALNQE